MRYRALFSRDVRKKRKVYHDGFVVHTADGAAPQLTDEGGTVLATAERGVRCVDPHAEGLDWFAGFLVDVDGVDGGDEGRRDAAAPGAAAPPPPPLPPPPPRPGLVGGSAAPGLRPPRRAAGTKRAAAFLAPPPAVERPVEPRAAATAAARTDDEILGLLAGRPPKPVAASRPPRPSATAAYTGWRPPRATTTTTTSVSLSRSAEAEPPRPPLAPRQPPATTRWADRRKRGADDDDGDDDGKRAPPADPHAALTAELVFPDARLAAAPPRRTAAIPTTFPTAAAYTAALAAAVVDELNIRLHLAAAAFRRAAAGFPPRSPPAAVERAARRADAEFYGAADLQATAGPSRAHADRGPPPGGGALFLTLRAGRLAASAYRQGDVWVIGSDANLAGLPPGAVGDRSAGPWVAVARALWHGPTTEGRLAVVLLTPRPRALRRAQPVCALRVGDAGTDLACLAALRGGGAGRVPVLPALLGAPATALPPATARAAADAAAHAAAARLNDDQVAVVDRLAAWAAAPAPRPPAVQLVRGPFGCGKSSLLVAAAAFLACGGKNGDTATTLPPGCGLRVLVVAHTNAAVDRVLVGLLDAGFDGASLLRVGPVRKIDRRLLPHSLASATAKKDEVTADLAAMLRDAPSRAAAAAVAAELARVKAGALTRRRALLASAAVVGATAVSAGALPADTPPFDVAVVDEASQLTEPLALLALAAARPSLCLVAGDPAQLPPVVCGPAAVARAPGAPPAAGLARSLLSRLLDAGGGAVLLRTQYRCHPAISALANAAFYGGALRDGVDAAARPPLVPGLPPVAFVPVSAGIAAADAGRSAYNEAEAGAVVRCVRAVRAAGVAASDVGVICFFRAQAALVGRLLARDVGENQGPASDAAAADAAAELPAVATTDAYQGNEKNVVILSTVVTRASPFASDAARVCVALTRGKHHLIVVGHPGALTADAVMGRVVDAAGVYRPR